MGIRPHHNSYQIRSRGYFIPISILYPHTLLTSNSLLSPHHDPTLAGPRRQIRHVGCCHFRHCLFWLCGRSVRSCSFHLDEVPGPNDLSRIVFARSGDLVGNLSSFDIECQWGLDAGFVACCSALECEDGLGNEGYDVSCPWTRCHVSLPNSGRGYIGVADLRTEQVLRL